MRKRTAVIAVPTSKLLLRTAYFCSIYAILLLDGDSPAAGAKAHGYRYSSYAQLTLVDGVF